MPEIFLALCARASEFRRKILGQTIKTSARRFSSISPFSLKQVVDKEIRLGNHIYICLLCK